VVSKVDEMEAGERRACKEEVTNTKDDEL